VVLQYLTILGDGWSLIGASLLTTKIENKWVRTLLMALAIPVLFVFWHVAIPAMIPALQYGAIYEIGAILRNIGIRVIGVFSGALISKTLSRKLLKSGDSSMTQEKWKATFRWAVSVGLVMGYFMYSIYFPFVVTNIMSISIPGITSPWISRIISVAIFDLGAHNVFLSSFLFNTLGMVFGEQQKGLFEGKFKESQAWKTLSFYFPINVTFWLPFFLFIWPAFPQGGLGLIVSSALVIVSESALIISSL